MDMLTVVCVYRPGGGFYDEYVTRLRDGVAEHCKAPHKFICLTNRAIEGVECVPLLRRNKGWWNKLELFRKGLFDGPVAYMDLDTMIVDDVTDIFTYDHKFTAGLNLKTRSPRPVNPILNSGVMMWDGRQDLSHLDVDVGTIIDDKYSQTFERWGDQGFIQDHIDLPVQDLHKLFPGRVVSYKVHVRPAGAVPEAASIVMFHGRPRPGEIEWKLP